MLSEDGAANLYPILKYFKYDHLPEPLKGISRGFSVLAWNLAMSTTSSAEVSAGLRKLLEAKDCFVRANLK